MGGAGLTLEKFLDGFRPYRPSPTVISNGASRRFFFRFRSCESVGLRREKSLFLLSLPPVIAGREEVDRLAASLKGIANGVFGPVSLAFPKLSPPELGFLRTVSYLFVLYHEVGKVEVKFLAEKFETYGIDASLEQHAVLVRELRTYLQHNLNALHDHDRGIQESCENWMRDKCGTVIPARDEHWNVCLVALLSKALELLDGMRRTIRAIELDESRDEIRREWQFRIERNHFPAKFDSLISVVAFDMGRGEIDPVKFRQRFYDQWARELSLLNPGYEFRVEGRKLIERALLSTLTPVLPITGRDIMDNFGLSPGPQIGELLETARRIYEQEPCTRETLLRQLGANRRPSDLP
jgi:hypothetical protein